MSEQQNEESVNSEADLEGLPNLDNLLDIPVTLTVEIGSCSMSMAEVLSLGPGAVIKLDRMADEPVEVFVNGKLFARGEVVVTGDHYGVSIVEFVRGAL